MDKKLLQLFAARAEQKEKSRLEVKEFDFPGIGKLAFYKPKQTEILEYMEALAEGKGVKDAMEIVKSVIYDCCPTLQDPELHQSLGVTDPYDTVLRLMDISEINDFGAAVFEWVGLTTPDAGGAAETAKNS